MIYRIQESIFFRNDDGRVWTDDDTCVILTATTGRLLVYLLQHKGNVISKDELLEKVWDAYGLSTSSNSLYKYISDLRAMFKKLGCSEGIIVTVPKLGFMIAKAVHVELVESSEREGPSVIEPVVKPNPRPALEPGVAQKKESNRSEELAKESEIFENNRSKYKRCEKNFEEISSVEKFFAAKSCPVGFIIALLSFALMVLVMASVFFYSMGDSSMEEEITWYLGDVDNCPVRSFNPNEAEESLAILKNVIATKGILCFGNSVFFIRVSDFMMTEKKGRVFISRCNYVDDKHKKFSSCENFYRADYDITR